MKDLPKPPVRALSFSEGTMVLQKVGDRHQTINPAGKDGPTWTTFDGELDEPVLVCRGCKHLAFNDYHYPYCSALEANNQYVKPDKVNYHYPWLGAGKHIYSASPTQDCPYPAPPKET